MNTVARQISALMSVTALMAVTFSSCGSGKRAVVTPARPQVVGEITLDQLVGSDAFVMTPANSLSSDARALVEAANRWLGTPYKYGGETHDGVDCSALVMNVYKESLGIKLPRTTVTQRDRAEVVGKGDLTVGDLLFFSSAKNRSGISHVGLYIGNDRFIHASSSRGVVVSRLSEKYFLEHYHSAGRVINLASASGSDIAVSHETPVPLEQIMEMNLDLLDQILTATIDSIYSVPVDDDPNLAPGL